MLGDERTRLVNSGLVGCLRTRATRYAEDVRGCPKAFYHSRCVSVRYLPSFWGQFGIYQQNARRLSNSKNSIFLKTTIRETSNKDTRRRFHPPILEPSTGRGCDLHDQEAGTGIDEQPDEGCHVASGQAGRTSKLRTQLDVAVHTRVTAENCWLPAEAVAPPHAASCSRIWFSVGSRGLTRTELHRAERRL